MASQHIVGLVVNPIAGIGGSVGLAGSDGADIQAEARARGGAPRAPARAERFVVELRRRVPGVRIESADVRSAEATAQLAAKLAALGARVLVFVGGDGTARDVLRGLAGGHAEQLCVGVPGGVKMHSGVFAVTPEDAAAQVAEVLLSDEAGREVRSEFRDVADLNEAARRRGELHTDVYGAMRVPLHARMQRGKRSPMQGTSSVDGAGIAEVIRSQHEGVLVFGPGTTVAEIAHHAGVTEPTLLGFDVLMPGGETLLDVTGTVLEALAVEHQLGIVLSPIGGQGFVIGRGNHQLTERVLETLDPERLFIVSGSEKLGELAGTLRIDAPTVALNARFRGYRRVLLGPVDSALVRLE
ncbi:ATP-NAD kinase family protein [Leucobacter chinensis]|uniref:ATP-NAD kinase family protein n=1 Tax=Leucobacter chinensis TaxID=2851010 RepID=UPI001C21F7FD|nr:NAD(+)/NADH kinase [Leucobacter chinensis]